MKTLKIMMVLIGMVIFNGCTTTKYRVIHIPVEPSTPCIFEKFSESEKAEMSESTKRKIRRNQKGCTIRYKKNYDMMQAHNKAHNGDKND